MTRPSRRSLLCGTASMIALSAGCVADDPGRASNGGGNGGDGADDGEDGEDGGNETDAGDGSPEKNDEVEDGDLPDGLADCETLPFQYPTRSDSPDAALFLEGDDANQWLAERDAKSERVTELVDETDFETSILVALEAGAPNPCYGMVLDDMDIDDGDANTEDDDTLALDAAVRETADEETACTQQLVTVGRLVRATFESEPLTRVSATIVDQHGQEHGIGIASESSSASDGSESDSRSDDA